MGGGTYSSQNRSLRAKTSGITSKPREQVFTQRNIHKDMNPNGVSLREARDSEAHPNSIPIIIALDVTLSMGHVPHQLVKDGLPTIMQTIIDAGIPDPQVMFVAIGDHKTDHAPLQISQFESGDEELDMWLTNVFLEGGGGGNGGESYSLAHFFANTVCVSDNWEKRGKKGYIFTIGDEANHQHYASNQLERIFGKQIESFTDKDQLELAQQKWHVFHIIPGVESYNEQGYWAKLLGTNAISLETAEQVAVAIATNIVSLEKAETVSPSTPTVEDTSDSAEESEEDTKITL